MVTTYRAARRRAVFPLLITVVLGGVFYVPSVVSAEVITGSASVIDAGHLKINDQKIRLYGIEAPDKGHACLRESKPWKCGAEASRTLEKQIEGKTVSCEPVPTSTSTNPVVAKCSYDGTDLATLMVREGWAVDDPKQSQGAFAEPQKEAKRARRGIWATESDNPEEVRRQRQQ